MYNDLRYALRQLRKDPGFTAVAVLSLALGIGANTAIFSIVDAVLIRPLPFKDPDSLVQVTRCFPSEHSALVSVPKAMYWIHHNQIFQYVAAYDFMAAGSNLAGGGEPERLRRVRVTADYFRVLGVRPLLGRNFLAGEDQPGAQRVAIVSHALWQRRFGADATLVGRSLTLGSESYTAIGVMPPGFKSFPVADCWTLLQAPANSRDQALTLSAVGRLKSGSTREAAQAGLDQLAGSFRQSCPELISPEEGIGVLPLHTQLVGPRQTALWLLLGSVGLVLVVACINLASLLLARAQARRREMGIRTALGAHRIRLVRQCLTESSLLALMGGVLGLFLGSWSLQAVLLFAASDLSHTNPIELNTRVLSFTAFVSLVALLIFGLVPALRTSSLKPEETLKESSRRTSGSLGRHQFNRILIRAEIALAVVLLINASLLLESFLRLRSVNTGFEARNIVTFQIALTGEKYNTTSRVANFLQEALEEIESLPGVQAAAAATNLPLEPGPDLPFTIEGRPDSDTADRYALYRAITPNFFRALRIPLLKGRFFRGSDTAKSPAVVIINENMARTYWRDEDPIGHYLTIGKAMGPEFADEPRQVVGVVGNVTDVGLTVPVTSTVLIPYAQVPDRIMNKANDLFPTSWVVRTDHDPSERVAVVRKDMAKVDPQLAVFNVRSMERVYSDSISSQRFNLFLFGSFALLAFLLALVGIYGVVGYAVEQRTHEIAIRVALGANRGDILRLVLGAGLISVTTGVLIGLVSAFGLSRLLSSLLFGVNPNDPRVFAVVSVLTIVVALLATYLPARRAAKVDPMVALRYE